MGFDKFKKHQNSIVLTILKSGFYRKIRLYVLPRNFNILINSDYFLERSIKIPINTPMVEAITTKATKDGDIYIKYDCSNIVNL